MQTTNHFKARMSQRGISKDMVNMALNYGRPEQDKYVLDRKEALENLCALEHEAKVLRKIADKGGVVVVANGADLITTYNYNGKIRKYR